MNRRISVYRDKNELWSAAAGLVRDLVNRAVRERGVFTVALSGGKTPEELYARLAGPELRGSIPWGKVFVFWGDERFVPLDHPESNFGMARRSLFAGIEIPGINIHPIPTDEPTPLRAAEAYEERVRSSFGTIVKNASDAAPVFDLVLLGMGKDGHTAALYPGGQALTEEGRLFTAVDAPDWAPVRQRITATLPLINNSRAAFFLVTGEDKKEMLKQVLSADKTAGDPAGGAAVFPAQLVRPRESLFWFTDIPIWHR
jgi:6-phosphogluconolactonase